MASLGNVFSTCAFLLVAASCSPSTSNSEESSKSPSLPSAEPEQISKIAPDNPKLIDRGLPIPQYCRVRPQAGSVELDLGLRGTLRFRKGCIVVIDDSTAVVIPIFPSGTRWIDAGRALQFGNVRLSDGDEVVWSVHSTTRNFYGDRSPQSGEEPVPSSCEGDRYVRVLD